MSWLLLSNKQETMETFSWQSGSAPAQVIFLKKKHFLRQYLIQLSIENSDESLNNSAGVMQTGVISCAISVSNWLEHVTPYDTMSNKETQEAAFI